MIPDPPKHDHPIAVLIAWITVVVMAVTMSACAPRPAVQGIPTPVPCRVELPADRTFPFDDLQPGADIFTQVATLLADRRERIDDRRQTRAAAQVCE